ncbi:MAG: glutamate racemase [Woeseiaceae bacterium]|nr:glutamate racemase [Woeseiaceae bacterium]
MNASSDNDLPVGIFDSGVGGLTVLKAIQARLPAENLIYLGDTARLPYGTKSPRSIERYATQATEKLRERGMKMLVVACNTASAVALQALREQMRPLPVIGVIEPGAAAAVSARPGGSHLVLATEATVRLGAYRAAIAALDPAATVREQACELLVALAEEGWTSGEIASASIRRYLEEAGGHETQADSIILGCTHFPLLKSAIRAEVPDDVQIVDSATTTAAVVADALAANDMLRHAEREGGLRLLATDGAQRFALVGGRFLGKTLTAGDIELCDL